MSKIIVVAAALVGLSVQSAWAQTTPSPSTATFQVTLNVLPGCNITTTNFAFTDTQGSQQAAPSAVTQNISMTCSVGTAYTVSFASSNPTDGDPTTMRMTDGAEHYVSYQLTSTGSTPITFGGTTAANELTGTADSADAISIPLQVAVTGWTQYQTVGHYSDTVTMTVSY